MGLQYSPLITTDTVMFLLCYAYNILFKNSNKIFLILNLNISDILFLTDTVLPVFTVLHSLKAIIVANQTESSCRNFESLLTLLTACLCLDLMHCFFLLTIHNENS